MSISNKKYFKFSGGEVHTNIDISNELTHRIVCTDYSMDGFMALCQQAEILRRYGMKEIEVIYPYFPYARQDRVINEHEPFSLKIFCQLLNAQNFYKVTVFDPHSDVTPALINNCVVIPQWDLAMRALSNDDLIYNNDVLFVSPDAGAYKKLSKLINNDNRIVIGSKIRNEYGNIVTTQVLSPVDIKGKTCVIVDDICDGGKTFVELAKVLKNEAGASDCILYVTHGIFSKGFSELSEYFSKIYTTDSFKHEDLPSFVKQMEML